MTYRHTTSFFLALAFILNSQHFAAAQVEHQLNDCTLAGGSVFQPHFGNSRQPTPTDSENVDLRLAQDYFHTVKKTTASPFAPPADTAMPNVKTIGTNLKAFGVPFKINADNASFIEVQLYLSRDMGKTWKFYARQGTDRNDFPFEADQDGEYWFSLKTLDRDRHLLPAGDPQAELKIVVDTVKPTLDFRIETDAAGRVACRWHAKDKNLSPESFQIYYQPISAAGPTKEWQKVPVDLNGKSRVGIYADQIAWWPDTTERQLNVAIEIRDIAGNVAQAQRQIVIAQSAWRHRSQSVAQITDTMRSESPGGSSQLAPQVAGDLAPSANPIRQRPVQPNQDATTATDETVNNSTESLATDHAPNVVCENGVCRVVSAQLIGSDVEYADPPSPDDYLRSTTPPLTQLAQNSSNVSRQDSVVWQSEPQKQVSGNRSTMGTTIGSTSRPDPSLAPQVNPLQTTAKPVTEVPSNSATMKNIGDKVIGESSTMGRSNQYRGLNSRNGAPLPPPTLLPSEPGNKSNGLADHSSPANYPNTGHVGFESMGSQSDPAHARNSKHPPQHGAGQWTQPQPASSGFSNAGFPNRGSSLGRNKPIRQNSQPAVTGQNQSMTSGAPVQIIGTKRFRLDYGIDAIDPSGVARVDLWMTLDGRNWNAWGNDPDNQSPFPVEVENDGRYGFRIVVHSKDGLTGQGPSTGDDADMWVLIDTQSPLTHISSVPYGRGDEAGRLVINYSVSDDQITLRPVTLAYSATPQGPWNVIGEGLRNERRYVWKPNSDVPDQIYLRIEALDKAGNVGVHVLNQAIDVSGLVPRGTIRGVSPVGRN